MDGWPTYVDDMLALVELTGRGTRTALGLWACDSARRACHNLLAARVRPGFAYDPRIRHALAELALHFRGQPANLELARPHRLWGEAPERDGLAEAVEIVALALDYALGSATAAAVAARARQAMLAEQGDWTAAREIEARWQARRLLWRTGLMPRFPEMLVRLDLAEHAGAVPRSGAALARFDDLRRRIHADEDARLDLIFEFGEALFLTELQLG
jgi:hypothetical protein